MANSPLSTLNIPTETSNVDDTPTTGALSTPDFIQVPGPKGSKATISGSNSEDILKNMQSLIDERNTPWSRAKLDFAEAAAAGQGNTGNVLAVQNQRNKNLSDIQNMQMEMAQFKAAQEQQRQAAIQDQQLVEAQTKGTGGAGTGTGTGYGGAGTSSLSPEDLRRYLGLKSQGLIEEANKFRDEALQHGIKARAELQYSPTQTELTTFTDANGIVHNQPRSELAAALKKYGNVPSPGEAAAPEAPQAPTAPTAPQATAKAPSTAFNTAIGHLLDREGGYKAVDGSSGSPVNFGINQRANPDIDVKNLTVDKAKEIFKTRYWDAINADSLPPKVASIAFDAAVNQGVDYAKHLLATTGGNPDKMLSQRNLDYVSLAQKNPNQAGNLGGWINRNEDVRNKLSKFEDTSQAQAQPTTAQAQPTDQAQPTAPAPAVSISKMTAFNPSDVDAALKQLVPPKPGSPPAQWEKYYAAQTAVRNSYIDAPLAIAKNAANTTAVRDAANAAARENQMKQLTHEADTYVPILDQMEGIAADPKNEKIFAIGNKSNDTFSKFASAAEHLGESPEQIKRDYLVWNRSIDNNDRAKMENFNSNSQ